MAVAPSKSAASQEQRSPSSSGYRPSSSSPERCAVITSSVSGRYSRSAAGTPLRQPPRTAGVQPERPDRAFCHRTTYTSGRAGNNAAKKATLAAAGEPACTGPGAASNTPVRIGPDGRASSGVSSSRRSNREFSARNRATSSRSPEVRRPERRTAACPAPGARFWARPSSWRGNGRMRSLRRLGRLERRSTTVRAVPNTPSGTKLALPPRRHHIPGERRALSPRRHPMTVEACRSSHRTRHLGDVPLSGGCSPHRVRQRCGDDDAIGAGLPPVELSR